MKEPIQFRTRRLANRLGGAFECWDKYVEKMPSLKDKNIKFIFDGVGQSPSRCYRCHALCAQRYADAALVCALLPRNVSVVSDA